MMMTWWPHKQGMVSFLVALRARRCPLSVAGALFVSLGLLVLVPSLAYAAGVRACFDLDDRRGSPFPSDRFTVEDSGQNTSLRVNVPKPDCAARPNDCANLDVINTLDGFNVQPRL
jgi:hypothetical protein